jgi:hypothetical protein
MAPAIDRPFSTMAIETQKPLSPRMNAIVPSSGSTTKTRFWERSAALSFVSSESQP